MSYIEEVSYFLVFQLGGGNLELLIDCSWFLGKLQLLPQKTLNSPFAIVKEGWVRFIVSPSASKFVLLPQYFIPL